MTTRKKREVKKAQTTGNAQADKSAGTKETIKAAAAGFPIVGIGASAGGLAAFEAFFSGMPAGTDPGMAFVLVQHLDPDHKSILSDLIRRYTSMQVYEVTDGIKVRPNCTYIIPPGRDMAFLGGTLQLLEPGAPRGQRLPIDFFFRSLANDLHERAICIVLSGTGSDGSQGVRTVKSEGGMAMTQDPESTSYDGMPRSAIATGLVDYVLAPAEMPAQLMAYAAHAFGKVSLRVKASPSPGSEDNLKKICVLLRDRTGHDFSQYKHNTLIRRVERRMAVHQIERQEDYLRFLRQTPAEAQALFRDLLIGVTSFFRDPEAFAVLERQVIPQLFAGKPPEAPVRVWVCGCATGEEAYSVAILMQEHLETLKQSFKVQVFATDIDIRAIEQARAGVYPAGVLTELTPTRLARFFTQEQEGGVYRIQKRIRDLLVFSEQDVIKDPPFSRIDLITCRNLLIYLNMDLQKKIISLFHYALNSKGVLFLGTSESAGDSGILFDTLDRKQKLYRRREDMSGGVQPALSRFVPPLAAAADRERDVPGVPGPDLRRVAEHTLLAQYAETGVLINGRGEIYHIYGRTGRYLEPAVGDAGMNILTMAREGLRPALTSALYKAVARKEPVGHPGLRVKTNGDFATVDLTVRPALGAGGNPLADMFLVILKESALAVVAPVAGLPQADSEGVAEDGIAMKRIAALEQELRNKEEYLQSTLEEMETSNEELKSTNEEMQSVNEELQSTNEELETSKEELQSVNEELATVNAELQNKVVDLSRVNNDMNNLLAGTGIATLFVDHQLQVVRFTPSATEMINLIQGDIGRPVAHIVTNLIRYDRLVKDVQAVLYDLVPREVEVQTQEGGWFLMHIRPYRTLENVIEGAVITFTDITRNKKTWKMLEERERQMKALVKGMFNACAQFESVFDDDGKFTGCRFVFINDAFERLLGVTGKQARGKMVHEVWPDIDPGWIAACGEAVESGVPGRFEMDHAPSARRYRCHVSRLGEGRECFYVIFEDITARQEE
jgi:two-component system, chemotaxis family, CheB/CheR fusion protein